MHSVIGFEMNSALAEIDSGLRSSLIGDQYEVVLKIRQQLQLIPFPLFANNVLLRLAESFQNGTNQLRAHIGRLADECESEFAKVFSQDELVRRLLKVSHSNDPEARGLTLRFLGSLAPLIADNKQVHHLVLTSLDSNDDFELKSAIFSLSRFARYSGDFSRGIVDKVAAMVRFNRTPADIKLELVAVFRHMHSDVDTTMRVFNLCEELLNNSNNNNLCMAVFSALTQLASVSPFAIPEQLHLLLTRLMTVGLSPRVAIVLLNNLKVVANSPHMWTDDQAQILVDYRVPVSDQLKCSAWLNCMIALTKVPTPTIATVIDNSSLVWTSLDSLRMTGLHVLCIGVSETYLNLKQLLPRRARPLDRILTGMFINMLQQADSLPAKFFHLLATYLNEITDFDKGSEPLIRSLTSSTHLNSLSWQCLAAVAETKAGLYTALNGWAIRVQGHHRPTILANFLYAPGVTTVPDSAIWDDADLWLQYKVARTAMRNGHSSSTALPLLTRLVSSTFTPSFRHWLNGLVHFCHAQKEICRNGRLTVRMVDSALMHHHKAAAAFRTSSIDRSTDGFPASFIDCLISDLMAVRSVLIAWSCAAFMPPSRIADISDRSKRLSNQLSICIAAFEHSSNKWTKLHDRCFDADRQTLYAIQLRAASGLVSSAGLMALIGKGTNNDRQPPVLPRDTVLCVRTRAFRSLILWARVEVARLDVADNPDQCLIKENADFFMAIQSALHRFPVYLPRYFFQRLQTTSITLQISSPRPSGAQTSVPLLSDQQLPIKVEGVVTRSPRCSPAISDHRSVHSVVLTASQQPNKGDCQTSSSIHNNLVRHVQPIKGYFEAQFLMSFPNGGTAMIETELIDNETRRRWTTDAKTRLKVITTRTGN